MLRTKGIDEFTLKLDSGWSLVWRRSNYGYDDIIYFESPKGNVYDRVRDNLGARCPWDLDSSCPSVVAVDKVATAEELDHFFRAVERL